MNLRRHRISEDVFADLAEGAGGAEAVLQLAAVERSKHLLLLRGVVERAATTGHPDAAMTAGAYDRLAALQDDAPGPVESVLLYPAVGAWLRSTLLLLDRDPAQADPGRLAAVAAAAAVRARAPLTIEARAGGGSLLLPSVGEALVSDGPATVRSTPGGAEVISPGGDVTIPEDHSIDLLRWRGLRRLAATANGRALDLIVDDLDPYRMQADLADRLPAADLPGWRSALERAWEILTTHHLATAAEIQAAHRVLSPLRSPAHGVVSGTASDAFGAVGLSAPADGLTLAATLAHEVQHAKLGALLDVVALVEPDDEGLRFYAPWREDPRPASGLLQGAYAYLGVSAFWRRQRAHEPGIHAHSEFARWRAGALGAVDTLMTSGLLTPAGKAFAGHMHRVLAGWKNEPVPPAALTRAQQEAQRHLTRWQQANGPKG
ncbi:HEXXH motif domain-containing protein [Nonomuraea sp. NPDC050022]|uniref:HEXXH motif domain-containing protein n=1 Tax=unclassified Nonomuraea TaxID=2593643 RepID=UPI00340CE000